LAANSIAPHPFLIVSTRVWILCPSLTCKRIIFAAVTTARDKSRLYDAPDDSLNVLCYKCSAGENENTSRGCCAAGKGVSITSHFLIFTTLRREGTYFRQHAGQQTKGRGAHTYTEYIRASRQTQNETLFSGSALQNTRKEGNKQTTRSEREKSESRASDLGSPVGCKKLCSFSRAHSLTIPDSALCVSRQQIRFVPRGLKLDSAVCTRIVP
jgi:hypothetical protein